MLGSHRFGATMKSDVSLATQQLECCACTVQWRALLLTHKPVLCFKSYKEDETLRDRKFIKVSANQKLSVWREI